IAVASLILGFAPTWAGAITGAVVLGVGFGAYLAVDFALITQVLPTALDRPFWLLDPPVPLRVIQHRPAYAGQALRLVRGPERIESGWWDAALTVRDYFVAEDAAAARYWIYRERDTEHARWFLHGRYA
ncbi:hypothetical protein LPZ50_25070, partial [Bordetella petrii]|nr:hypothetical protein [Bordetella petrii]